MKRIYYILIASIAHNLQVFAQTSSTSQLGSTEYTLDVGEIFPTPRKVPNDNGIDNISSFITGNIPLLTTLMAVGAVLMLVLGGFHMVLGGASTEQTEKGKGIIKDAIMGLVIGLLAYVIITTLGNILDV